MSKLPPKPGIPDLSEIVEITLKSHEAYMNAKQAHLDENRRATSKTTPHVLNPPFSGGTTIMESRSLDQLRKLFRGD